MNPRRSWLRVLAAVAVGGVALGALGAWAALGAFGRFVIRERDQEARTPLLALAGVERRALAEGRGYFALELPAKRRPGGHAGWRETVG